MKDYGLVGYGQCSHCGDIYEEEVIEICETCLNKVFKKDVSLLGPDAWDTVAEGEDNRFTCDLCKKTYLGF